MNQNASFDTCSRCKRRCYCSAKCARADYIIHKKECKAAAAGATAVLSAEPTASNAAKHHKEKQVWVGEEVIVCGLEAKPAYNDRLGIIVGGIRDGRYPLKLQNHPSNIAIKPINFRRLGICMVTKSNEGIEFFCNKHGHVICTTCCIDTAIPNQLLNLKNRLGSVLSATVGAITAAHFASLVLSESGAIITNGKLDPGLPMESYGLDDPIAQTQLMSLLNTEDKSFSYGCSNDCVPGLLLR